MDPIGDLRKILDNVSDGVYVVDTQRRITYWNPAAERLTGFAAPQVCGRCCADNILTHVDNTGKCLCTGSCLVAQTLVDGQVRQAVINLHHKSGHRIPVQVSVRAMTDSAGQIVGAVETFRECSDVIALRSVVEQLKKWNSIDLPTGLASRRVIALRLEQSLAQTQRFGWPTGILLIEPDLQETLRRQSGDEGVAKSLRMAAQSVQYSLRSLDMVGRWDDSRFLAVIANGSQARLPAIAERVRAMVDAAYLESPDGQLHITVSIGAAAADGQTDQDTLLRHADRCLYDSRTAGRNRVSIYGWG